MITTLQQALSQVLPDGKLCAQHITKPHSLQLYLIDADYSVADLTSEQAQKVMDTPLYWLFCWASGRVLAQRIVDEQVDVADKVIMDFGAGSGVVAIAAAMMGAKKVIAADIDPVSQLAIKANAALNHVELDIIGDFRQCRETLDMICVADVLYDKSNWPLLDDLLDACPNMLLADSRVRNFQHPKFVHKLQVPGETWPNLGGFDEFNEVNIYGSLGL